jgi:ATP-dependent DNA ligase
LKAQAMEFPTLYHKGKTGKIVEWKVWTKGADVHVEWGEIGGKKQTTHTTSTIKNAGKKNEILPEKQAEIEAAAMHKHRLDRKYSLSIKEAQETVFLPMLAHEFEKKKHTLTYPVDVQPKLDGLRAMAYWESGEVKLLSRGGKFWNIPHLTKELEKVLEEGLVLDGEIYKHGTNLQNINKLAKKHREGDEGSISLEYRAFDIFDPDEELPWNKRRNDLALFSVITEKKKLNSISVVQVEDAKSEQEVKDLCQTFVEAGYEGAIVRNMDGLYALGERSSDLLKVKNFQDAEFEIVGHYLGEGKHEGTVGWWCETKEGKRFKCYPRGTMEDRRIKDPYGFYGKFLKIRYQFLTDEGIPFLPIGLAIRLEEDM